MANKVSTDVCVYIYIWSLQAAAYGLPVVATKNGGPVDILKVRLANDMIVMYL